MVSGSVTTSYRRSFPLLKDAIVVLRSDIKHRFRAYIMVASSSERNMLRMSFVSSVVYHVIVILANNVKNMALIYRSVL